MAISIPGSLVEFILLGPLDDRRQLQDSPILGDVWVEFGKRPSDRIDLLIAPYRGKHASSVAAEIDGGLETNEDLGNHSDYPDVAFLQGLIVARLTFEEVMGVVAPKTKWWIKKWVKDEGSSAKQKKSAAKEKHDVQKYVGKNGKEAKRVLKEILESAQAWHSKGASNRRLQELPSIERFLALTALILWAKSAAQESGDAPSSEKQITCILKQAQEEAELDKMVELLLGLAKKMLRGSDSTCDPLVWQVSLNRTAMPAISRSIPAVKADAATTLFKVNCSGIGWAVIDSGIDGAHPAFLDSEGNSRVKKSFDFKNFRKIVSLSNTRAGIRKQNVEVLMKNKERLVNPPSSPEAADKILETLAFDARNRGPVHWDLVEQFVEIKPDTRPPTNHGTHVAGILGASKTAAENVLKKAALDKAAQEAAKKAAASSQETAMAEAVKEVVEKIKHTENPDLADGMCPDISLYDFRVLGPDLKDTEFAIIAALQFIRHLNNRDNFLTIHGANLSLSIPHDVRNFACGRTPVCEECERLIASGVVVVAAAGNHGYKSFETKDGSYDSYAAFSITDPGNADNVLTVGATHRFWPHTYGVSFFSSRGPTGDGRLKPDLVAPGERIRAPMPGGHKNGGEWGDLDGTSMAAPHVSGAAAMLMARYSELIGQPLRLKRILCQSATDLSRERSFQGHGMLDVLRAFQSI